MKLKASDVIEIYESLTKIADREIDFNTACIIANDLKVLTPSKEVTDKRRDSIVAKYAVKTAEGNIEQDENGNIKIVDANSFMKEMDELLKSETDIDIKLIPKDSIKELHISAKDVMGLMHILED